jgi:rfaE bifunctional protein nucleotidyltransferase chain/domain
VVRSRDKKRPLHSLSGVIRGLKRRGRKIVLANGCFDILHVGHLQYLEGAKRRGDVLVVAVNDDASVRRIKGSGRPLMRISDRASLVAALGCVDYVTIFRETTVERVLRALKPDIHAKGGDYRPETVPERRVIQSLGGRVAIVGGPKIRSTTNFIRKIRKRKAR